MSESDEIVFETQNAWRKVTLNRPKALNALTHDMCLVLYAELKRWTLDRDIAGVVINGAGDRAFCAGGDIRNLYDEGRKGGRYPYDFYRDEYRLNARIKHFPKPYVALMDGIVMGGGVGVSVHGSHRVVTERTVFAMPESGIGLFPDVGGSYFLSRTPGNIGMYLALTGQRLTGADCLVAEIGDFYVPSDRLDALMRDLAGLEARDEGPQEEDVSAVIRGHSDLPGEAKIAMYLSEIEEIFSAECVEGVLEALDANGSDWAGETAAMIRTKSPTSLKLAHRQIREGAYKEFDDCMRMELRMVNRIITGHDFYEGTRATIIDRDQKPNWRPARLEDVTDEMIDAYFAPLEAGELVFDG